MVQYIQVPRPENLVPGEDCIFPFPSDFCRDVEEKQALLSCCTFHDSVTWMQEVMEYFLSGRFFHIIWAKPYEGQC